jgi:hypothetical protein
MRESGWEKERKLDRHLHLKKHFKAAPMKMILKSHSYFPRLSFDKNKQKRFFQTIIGFLGTPCLVGYLKRQHVPGATCRLKVQYGGYLINQGIYTINLYTTVINTI